MQMESCRDNNYIHFFNNDLCSVKGELNLKEISHSYDESEEIQNFFLLWLFTIEIICFVARASYYIFFWISEATGKANQKNQVQFCQVKSLHNLCTSRQIIVSSFVSVKKSEGLIIEPS